MLCSCYILRPLLRTQALLLLLFRLVLPLCPLSSGGCLVLQSGDSHAWHKPICVVHGIQVWILIRVDPPQP